MSQFWQLLLFMCVRSPLHCSQNHCFGKAVTIYDPNYDQIIGNCQRIHAISGFTGNCAKTAKPFAISAF